MPRRQRWATHCLRSQGLSLSNRHRELGRWLRGEERLWASFSKRVAMRRKGLSFVEASLDEVALAVEPGIDGSLQPPRAQGWDVGPCARPLVTTRQTTGKL